MSYEIREWRRGNRGVVGTNLGRAGLTTPVGSYFPGTSQRI